MLDKIIKFLDGKKTYLTALVAAVVLVAEYQGYIDALLANQILVLLGFGGIAFLRMGVSRNK